MKVCGSKSSPNSKVSHCSRCSHCSALEEHRALRFEASRVGQTSTIRGAVAPSKASSKPDLRAATPRRQVTFVDNPSLHLSRAHNTPVDLSNHMPMAISQSMDPHLQPTNLLTMPIPMSTTSLHRARLQPFAPAPVLHDLGRGPEPLFGWESVMPLNHGYGQPKYMKRVKPDYRRFCFSVGKADVPFAAMPGGPLWGMDVTMAPQMVGSHR